MFKTRPSNRLAAMASTALVAGALTLSVAPSASAAPVFIDVDTTMATDAAIGQSGGCVLSNVISPDVTGPVIENGPPTVQSASGTSTSSSGGNPDASISTSGTGSASLKSVGGLPTAIDFTSSGSVSIDTVGATSACTYSAYTQHDFYFHFTLSQPGILHLDTKSSKGAYSYVYLYQVDPTTSDDPYYNHYGFGSRFSGQDEVYLPPGDWYGQFYAEAYASANADKSVSTTSQIHATFHAVGSQTEAVAGKGKKYVTLPGARSCATQTVDTAVTGKRKRADKIKQVTYFVNDHKVKKVKTPDKKDSVKLAVAPELAAEVRVEVKLFPKKKGRPAKTYEVRASYEACS
jgi:hypothetical protein